MNRSREAIYQAEMERLRFIWAQDGILGMLSFARQSYRQYRHFLRRRDGFGRLAGYGRAYRTELLVSCIVFRRIIYGTEAQRVLLVPNAPRRYVRLHEGLHEGHK